MGLGVLLVKCEGGSCAAKVLRDNESVGSQASHIPAGQAAGVAVQESEM